MARAAVFGMGVSGKAAKSFLQARGWEVVTVDDRPLEGCVLPDAIEVRQLDCLVVSPGVPPSHPLLLRTAAAGVEVIGDVELALRASPKAKLLAVTGTNGKTTVTLLTTAMLQAHGLPALAAGNIGTPLVEALDAEGWLVVELSSAQLLSTHTRAFHAGTILNITPDHLDYHGSMESYAAAKLRLLDLIQGSAYLHEQIATDRFCQRLPAATSHDAANFMAARALAMEAGVPPGVCLEAFRSFQKPLHRIQHVRTIGGVHYVDDSKGTNIDAVCRAVETCEGPALLLAGGVHKGMAYTAWIASFGNKVKKVYAFGQAAACIAADLASHVPVELVAGLDEAVRAAAAMAQPGDTVLLSPGCSSFDQFRDYHERGMRFQEVVKQL